MGGVVGALVGFGIPEYEAKRYEGRVREGGILLSVHSDGSQWTKRAEKILEQTGKKAEALKAYQEFLSHFEHSTAKLPQIAEARAAVKRLK